MIRQLLFLSALLLVAACTEDSTPDSLPSHATATAASTAAPPTTLSDFGAGFVEWSVSNAADSDLTENQARCLARRTLAAMGEDRLLEVGASPDGSADGVGLLDGDVELSPSERRGVAAAFDACFDDPWAWIVDTADPFELCVVEGVKEAGVTLEQFIFAELPEYEDVVGLAIVEAMESC